MKKILAISCLVLGLSVMAAAQSKTHGVDKREKNQKQRIVNGVKSGDLTLKETGKLVKQQAEIRKAERRAKSDGKVTAAERLRLHHKLNQSSRNIRRKKNN
ncbi:MAG: hypothetical protein R2747_20155 [Pyrinomonadaceae bacterium]